MTTQTDTLTSLRLRILAARLAKADRIVTYLDDCSQRRGIDISRSEVAEQMAERLREAPREFWRQVADACHERGCSAATAREVIRAYEIRAVLSALYADAALETPADSGVWEVAS